MVTIGLIVVVLLLIGSILNSKSYQEVNCKQHTWETKTFLILAEDGKKMEQLDIMYCIKCKKRPGTL